MPEHKDAMQIIRDADELISQARQGLEATDEFLRSQGLNPEKVRAVVAEQMSDKDRRDAEEQFRIDMEAVDREVAEEAARASFASAPARSTPSRRPRAMV